jgi:hypothetical protein
MKGNLNKILDDCIDRINRGEAVEDCLADYPEHRQALESLLQAMFEARSAYIFTPSTKAKSFHKQRFSTALATTREERENKQPLLKWISSWSKVWAPIAVVVIAIVVYFGISPALTTPVMIAQPNPEGNFVVMLSDEVNDIGDFRELNISVSKVGLHLVGDEEKIIEFEPETQTADLTYLQGDQAQEIWRGDIPVGEYSKVFIEVSDVSGILLESGEEAEIKLPSSKLHISAPFIIETGETVNFVYDLTVVKAGKSGKYVLKPQASQSGVHQDFIKVDLSINNDKSSGHNNIEESESNQAIDKNISKEEYFSCGRIIGLGANSLYLYLY